MPDREKKTVLVVDDDEDLSALVDVVLSEEGYEVEIANNGEDGLAAIARGLPDLILLDMKMPVMDGKEFARRFHAEFGNGSPIVILTASVDGSHRADNLGAQDWVAKPFDIDALVASVRKNIRNSGSRSD